MVGGNDGTIGIAHDRLIRNWSDASLQTWLADDTGDRKLIDTLKSFLAAHQDGGPLLSEKSLLDAKDFLKRDHWLKDDEPELAHNSSNFCHSGEDRLRRRKWQFRGASQRQSCCLPLLRLPVGSTSKRKSRRVWPRSRLSKEALDQGDPSRAARLALAGLPSPLDWDARPWEPQAVERLRGRYAGATWVPGLGGTRATVSAQWRGRRKVVWSAAAALTAGCGCGIAGADPTSGRARRHDGWVRQWRCCRTDGSSAAARTGGCRSGTRPQPAAPGRARPPRRPGRRWRCCRTGGWSAAAATAGCAVGPGRPGDRLDARSASTTRS